MNLRTVSATRYVTPLREGGSLPAIVEADDDGMYVVKFRGAGHGTKALIAELVAGEIIRAAGLQVPEIVFVEVDAELARNEPDEEIRELIVRSAGLKLAAKSVGLNLALDYLPGSIAFDPLVEKVDSETASAILWLDAFLTNVDRTARNVNMLMWHRKLWLIDHGASLYFHFTWQDYLKRSREPFSRIIDHVFLSKATSLAEIDSKMIELVNPDLINQVVELIPDDWLSDDDGFQSKDEHRRAYIEYLTSRLQPPRVFVEEAIRARTTPV